jgi:hypothetical protein
MTTAILLAVLAASDPSFKDVKGGSSTAICEDHARTFLGPIGGTMGNLRETRGSHDRLCLQIRDGRVWRVLWNSDGIKLRSPAFTGRTFYPWTRMETGILGQVGDLDTGEIWTVIQQPTGFLVCGSGPTEREHVCVLQGTIYFRGKTL